MLIMNIHRSIGIQGICCMWHHYCSSSSRSGALLLRPDYCDPAVSQDMLQMINVLEVLMIQFCCNALQSKKLIRRTTQWQIFCSPMCWKTGDMQMANCNF